MQDLQPPRTRVGIASSVGFSPRMSTWRGEKRRDQLLARGRENRSAIPVERARSSNCQRRIFGPEGDQSRKKSLGGVREEGRKLFLSHGFCFEICSPKRAVLDIHAPPFSASP